MTHDTENHPAEGRSADVVRSRRDVLKLGSIATLGAILGGGVLLGHNTPALADTDSAPLLSPNDPLNIVIAVYPGGTLLDFAGPSEVFHRIPNTTVRYASVDGGPVTLEFGVVYGKTERLADIAKADLILVPGGADMRAAMRPEYLAQIRRLSESAKFITSVCTGSLALAAAGVLNGKRSACHWAFVNKLALYGAIPVPDRFVEDDNGRFMSGGGVTSGIDFALRVAARLRGAQSAEFAQLLIEYDPDPPYHSGHPRSAPPAILAMVEEKLPGATKGLAALPGVR
ncbi:DJ-1/PfpI family protein [Paraburkholderia sp. D15]|uniref:DJ-1/PfpI family protein n=1 Tax=Paraburkholderia sp. D15 TaxID=2880218 RepID=UPI0024798D04|nr:DJ-1/PfpI family protein [Paraburkholderia sp. D15]WGS54770.1 DJ-1/PfpI family protein [Paraburkholderia sp. D15]WKF60130.1 Isonitrile hydratase [Paraburkholderia busanensis]